MSRVSRGEILDSPCRKFLKWQTVKETVVMDGDEVEKLKGGNFSWYDKDAEKNVAVPKPFKFAILNNDLVTFKGFNEGTRQGVWSNEVSGLPKDKEQVVTLRNKAGKLMSFKIGEYKDNKDAIEGHFAKYGRSVYVGVKNEEREIEMQNLQLIGAPLSGGVDMKVKNPDEAQDGWFNFTRVNKNKLYTHWIVVENYKIKKKGTNKYTIPVYTIGEEISKEDGLELDNLDTELKKYLEFYFNKKEEVKEEAAETVDTAEDDDNTPY